MSNLPIFPSVSIVFSLSLFFFLSKGDFGFSNQAALYETSILEDMATTTATGAVTIDRAKDKPESAGSDVPTLSKGNTCLNSDTYSHSAGAIADTGINDSINNIKSTCIIHSSTNRSSIGGRNEKEEEEVEESDEEDFPRQVRKRQRRYVEIDSSEPDCTVVCAPEVDTPLILDLCDSDSSEGNDVGNQGNAVGLDSGSDNGNHSAASVRSDQGAAISTSTSNNKTSNNTTNGKQIFGEARVQDASRFITRVKEATKGNNSASNLYIPSFQARQNCPAAPTVEVDLTQRESSSSSDDNDSNSDNDDDKSDAGFIPFLQPSTTRYKAPSQLSSFSPPPLLGLGKSGRKALILALKTPRPIGMAGMIAGSSTPSPGISTLSYKPVVAGHDFEAWFTLYLTTCPVGLSTVDVDAVFYYGKRLANAAFALPNNTLRFALLISPNRTPFFYDSETPTVLIPGSSKVVAPNVKS